MRIMCLPYRTHCRLLNFICDDVPIDFMLQRRFIKFIHGAITSDNTCVQMCGKLALMGSRSATCNSINMWCHTYNMDKHLLSKKSVAFLVRTMYSTLDMECEDARRGAMIREVLSMRGERGAVLTLAEADLILMELCVN